MGIEIKAAYQATGYFEKTSSIPNCRVFQKTVVNLANIFFDQITLLFFSQAEKAQTDFRMTVLILPLNHGGKKANIQRNNFYFYFPTTPSATQKKANIHREYFCVGEFSYTTCAGEKGKYPQENVNLIFLHLLERVKLAKIS